MDKQQRFLALQSYLLAKVRKRVTALVGKDSPELVRYQRAFVRSLPLVPREASPDELQEQILVSQIILFSDFHSLPSNQKHFLDLLCDLQTKSKEPFFIALECFSIQDQDHIELYLQGKMSEQILYEKTNFRSSWGFPWGPVQKLLRFAKDQGIPVGGINLRTAGARAAGAGAPSLQERDIAFAKHIVAFQQKFPHHKMICLVGELHLANAHLPKQIKKLSPYLKKEKVEKKRVEKEKAILRILSNTDKYYFAVLKKQPGRLASCLRVDAKTYCLLDTPPWAKWLTFLFWQEHLLQHPDCSGCARPWLDSKQSLCNYEIDEYLYECMQVFLKFFKSIKKYPPQTHISDSQIVPALDEFAAKTLSEWSYQFFLQCGSYYEPKKERVYWQALSWRGLLAALTQSLLKVSPQRPGNKNLCDQEQFVWHVKLSLACHALESVFNPVGYLNHAWFGGAQACLKEAQLCTLHDFCLSYDLGKRFAYVLNQAHKHRDNGYGYLHTLLCEGRVEMLPYLAEFNKLRMQV